MNIDQLTVYQVYQIFKELLPQLTITYPETRFLFGGSRVPALDLYSTDRVPPFLTQEPVHNYTYDCRTDRNQHVSFWAKDRMGVTDFEYELSTYKENIKIIRAHSSNFDKLYVELEIDKKALAKQSALEKSRLRAAKKKLTNFTYPHQRYIAQRINEFFNAQATEALRLASIQMGIDTIVSAGIATCFTHDHLLLRGLDANEGKPDAFDATGEELHRAVQQLSYYKEVMEHLFNVQSKQEYGHGEDLAAACRRFVIVYGGDTSNYAVGMIDTHELVRKLSISRRKDEVNV